MSLIRIATRNLFEEATSVTVTGTPTTGYPAARLWDRGIAREFRMAGAGGHYLTFTGGLSAAEANALIIPAGHSLSGLAVEVWKSADGATWGSAYSSATPASNAISVQEFTAVAAAYWRLRFPVDSTVALAEAHLTNILTFERAPARPGGALETEFNVSVDPSSAGVPRYIEYGPERRRRSYEFANYSATGAAEIKARLDALRMAKDFWLCDHAGVWIFGNVLAPVIPVEIAAGRCSFSFDFLETPAA